MRYFKLKHCIRCGKVFTPKGERAKPCLDPNRCTTNFCSDACKRADRIEFKYL